MVERGAFDATDPLLARVAWARIAEPGDIAAGALVRALGPVAALDWLRTAAAAPPQLPAHPGWVAAGERWRPRLRDLDPRRECSVIDRLGGVIIVPGDRRWPAALDDLGDAAPLTLWVRGNSDLPAAVARSVSLVGARASTRYGDDVAVTLASGLVHAGWSIVSGGAFGIDAAAHRGTLAVQGRAIAVMAGGLDRLYPVANTELLEQIVATGAVVSEAPPGTAPMRQRFLARNRLIAAISQATVVVEAAWRSGALSTARHAAELLRPVGAVPGPVTSAASAGCHRLLREGSAVCVTDAAEVEELARPLSQQPVAVAQPKLAAVGVLDGLDGTQAAVFEALPARGAAHVDNLARVGGLSVRAALTALGSLELAGQVERIDGLWRRTQR